jgi:Transglutaminase-like superfamily.
MQNPSSQAQSRAARAWGVVCLAAGSLALVLSMALGFSIKSGRDLVRMRNSLLVEVHPATAYDWTPAKVPGDFLWERRAAPAPIAAAAAAIRAGSPNSDDFAEALAIAAKLAQNKKSDKPIQSDTLTAYHMITERGLGYCADYTEVFLALAHASGIPVREWGAAFDAYGGDGHAFVEIYDRGRAQWIFIDPFYSFYVTAAGRPLSVAELQSALRAAHSDLRVVPIVREKFGFKAPERALAYYRRGAARFYLWWGNNIFSYEHSPLVAHAASLSRSAEQVAAIFAGVQPKLVLATGNLDESALRSLERLRAMMLGIVVASATAGIALLGWLVSWWRSRRRKSEN